MQIKITGMNKFISGSHDREMIVRRLIASKMEIINGEVIIVHDSKIVNDLT